jgi:predicted TIM-barrel fold metal-dependent hydrolase
MRYDVISADCHLDFCWLPPDLFTANARLDLRDRMPYVKEASDGRHWTTKGGADLGVVNGMGGLGRHYVPGRNQRADRMATLGLYEDGRRGIRRLSEPDLRVKDQDRDGVQAEVLYGIAGTVGRLNDPEASLEVTHIYNDWLADFCMAHPSRFAGLASIPNHPIEAAVIEVERIARRGVLRGLEIANSTNLTPLWDPCWQPLWEVANDTGLPLHFHLIGGSIASERVRKIELLGADPTQAGLPGVPDIEISAARAAFAVRATSSQLNMAGLFVSMIYGGILERYPRLKVVLGESAIGWIPYVLWRIDLEWEKQFRDLPLSMPPSEYWKRQCWATYQTDPIGIRLLDRLGVEKVMWGSDFPHPDGTWPDSQEYLARELGDLPAEIRRKLVCENAAQLYGFPLN